MAEVKAKASLDSTHYNNGLKKMESETERSTKGMSGNFAKLIGAVAGGAAAGFLLEKAWQGAKWMYEKGKEGFSMTHDLAELAEVSNTTTERLQMLGQVARRSGLETEDVAKALQTMGAKINEAIADPTSKAAKAFTELFGSLDELPAMAQDSGVALVKMADALDKASFSGSKMKAASELMGSKFGKRSMAFMGNIAETSFTGTGSTITTDRDAVYVDLLMKQQKHIKEIAEKAQRDAAVTSAKAVIPSADVDAEIEKRKSFLEKKKQADIEDAKESVQDAKDKIEKPFLKRIEDIKKEKERSEAKEKPTLNTGLGANSLQQMGGSFGAGGMNEAVRIASRQLEQQQKSLEYEEKIAEATSEMKDKLKEAGLQ